ncbi:MAG: sigma-E factor negative regulatory protein [Gammaproteobacteria bacterium]|nr:sigma-E factor negative regulatory protein [Gammaproteobacteria bacterium]MCY4356497.1 sigma-E factor negative regulatory protein [Gammaproteobacteria bacterium]
MSDFENQALSAIMDGETDEFEMRRLLKSMQDDPGLAARWQRYHLVQSVLHDRGIPVSSALAERIAAALESEPALGVERKPSVQWRMQFTRVAIAACVAIVTVLILMPTEQSTPKAPALVQESGTNIIGDTLEPKADIAPQEGIAVTLVSEGPTRQVDPAAQQRLQDYIEAMRFDPEEPVRIEHIQDSPLYRLVNDYQTKP